jgi:hypothetical protein
VGSKFQLTFSRGKKESAQALALLLEELYYRAQYKVSLHTLSSQ